MSSESTDASSARAAGVRARGYARIATEEAFAPSWMLERYQSLLARRALDDPGFNSLWGFYLGSRSARATQIIARLKDLGPQRLADMDATGIDRQIISLTSPGVQVFDRASAVAMARDANDELSAAVRSHPERYAGLAAVAPQDPQAAAAEIDRGMGQLGMKGVIINSHTLGEYLDDPKYSELFAAAEAANAPIYLHPNTPSKGMIAPLRENVYVTTSGMPWGPAIRFCQQVLGVERVLYAMDYPYQFVAQEVTLSDQVPMSDAERRLFFQVNAERVFSL